MPMLLVRSVLGRDRPWGFHIAMAGIMLALAAGWVFLKSAANKGGDQAFTAPTPRSTPDPTATTTTTSPPLPRMAWP
jgi:hypothetical protein